MQIHFSSQTTDSNTLPENILNGCIFAALERQTLRKAKSSLQKWSFVMSQRAVIFQVSVFLSLSEHIEGPVYQQEGESVDF